MELKRIVESLKAAWLCLWMPRAHGDATTVPVKQIPSEALCPAERATIERDIARMERTDADLKYAMRLLWHIHRSLESVDLMEPDVFALESALTFARLAPKYLQGPWAVVKQEMVAETRRNADSQKPDV